jgi:hypothetical protein
VVKTGIGGAAGQRGETAASGANGKDDVSTMARTLAGPARPPNEGFRLNLEGGHEDAIAAQLCAIAARTHQICWHHFLSPSRFPLRCAAPPGGHRGMTAVSLMSFDRAAGADLLAGDGSGPRALCQAIEARLRQLGLQAEMLEVSFDPAQSLVSVAGCAISQDMRERILLCCGNVRGVAAVEDRMTVVMPSNASRWRFVQNGETLATIAADAYRDARRQHQLRDANRHLLGDGDELQPGWLLRVPA